MHGRTKKLTPLNSERQVLRACLEVLQQWGLQDHIKRQNTGGAYNSQGKLVMFGTRGQSDLGGVLPVGWGFASGKRIIIEVKREGFKPPKNGHAWHKSFIISEKRKHWVEQLEQLRLVNHAGGYGLWCDDHEYLWRAFKLIQDGYRVRIAEDERPEFYREDGI